MRLKRPEASLRGPRRAPRSAWLILGSSLGFAIVSLDVSIVNVALATMARTLHSDIATLQWVVDAYTVTFASLLLTGGALSDRFGARRLFVIGFGVFAAASFSCGLAPSAASLIVARAVQGVGAAVVIPSSLALINYAYADDPPARAEAIALWTTAGAIALAAGPIIGGVLIQSVGWRSIFFVNVPISLAGAWLILKTAKETPEASRPLDLAGQILAIVGLATLIAAVINAGKPGRDVTFVFATFAAAAICAGLFLVVESRLREPMLPLKFFGRPVFRTANVVGFVANLSVYGEIFVLGLFWQQLRGYSPLVTGLAFLPFCAALSGGNLLSGKMYVARGPKLPLAVGQLVSIAGCLLVFAAMPNGSYFAMLPGIIIFPLGIAIAVPAMSTALLSSVETEYSGVASGVLNAVRQAAGALGVAILGSLFAARGLLGAREGLIICSGLLALGTIVTMRTRA
jgi:MFS transporter, DHA2 family, methylenomycin A resistance protein